MIWIYILIFIPLISATRRRDELSYRSNVIPGNKPILILYAKAKDYSEFDSDEDRQTSSPPKMKVPGWARKRLVRWLSSLLPFEVQNTPQPYYPIPDYYPPVRDESKDRRTGPPSKIKVPEWSNRRIFSWVKKLLNRPPEYPYSQLQMLRNKVPNGLNADDKPVLRMPSNDNEDFVSSFNEDNKPVLRLPSEDNDDSDSESSPRTKTKRSKHKNKKKLREQKKPDWVTDLKDFIKDLTSHHGLEEVLQRAQPVIRSIEKEHRVKVKDVDVDEFGEIHITYFQKKKKSARHGNKVDET